MIQVTSQLNPTPHPDSPSGVLIPRTIEEAMVELDRLLPPVLQSELAPGRIPDRLPLELRTFATESLVALAS